jgi:hypothetical protein
LGNVVFVNRRQKEMTLDTHCYVEGWFDQNNQEIDCKRRNEDDWADVVHVVDAVMSRCSRCSWFLVLFSPFASSEGSPGTRCGNADRRGTRWRRGRWWSSPRLHPAARCQGDLGARGGFFRYLPSTPRCLDTLWRSENYKVIDESMCVWVCVLVPGQLPISIIDGSSHFLSCKTPTGATLIKRRHLELFGCNLVSVTYCSTGSGMVHRKWTKGGSIWRSNCRTMLV